jgi:cbb3-type cytochrome oxidase maturation protein
MSILFILIPLSVALMGAAVWALFWAIDNGQFDDLEANGRSVLEEDEEGRKHGPSP